MTVKTRSKTSHTADVKKTPKPAAKNPVSKSKVGVKDTRKKKSWNDMAHLLLKRFRDDDPKLTPGAKRDRLKHPHLVVAEYDPSGRSTCKLCGEKIAKGSLRFTLYLECHKGYRNACTLHEDCFGEHPERAKVQSMDEIHLASSLSKESRASIAKAFLHKSGSVVP